MVRRAVDLPMVVALILLCAGDTAAQDTGPLPRGNSRISGKVIDADSGLPVTGARVDLRVTSGGSPANAVTTDGFGAFVIDGFAGGAYRLSASRLGYVEAGPFAAPVVQAVTVADGQHLEGLTIRLRRAVVLTGTVVDEYGDPVDGINVFAHKMHYGPEGVPTAGLIRLIPDRTNDLGQFRLFGLPPGDYLVSASGRNPGDSGMPVLMGPITPSDTVATYYPGTPRVNEAQVVSVSGGEERMIHFALSRARPVTVSGTAVTSAGRPASGMRVNLRAMDGESMTIRGAGTTSAAGAFSIAAVSPGEYWVEVSPGPGTFTGERGAARIEVDSQDVSGLSIVTKAGATLTGTVVFNSSSRPGTFQIRAQPVNRLGGTAQPGYSDVVARDGSFVIRNVADQAFLEPANDLWMTTSVVVDGRDLGEEPLDLGGLTSLSDVRVTVTDRLTDVSGSVADDGGQPLAGHNVVFLRLDAPALPPDRRVRLLRTNATGDFQVRGLRPGTWAVGVVAELDTGQQYAPAFQEALRANGRKISLGPGEPLILELGVTTGL